MDHAIAGVHAAAATPVADDGRFLPDLFIAHLKELLDEGCHGLAILGTTGEANSFGLRERKEILETAISGGISPDTLLPGASAPSIADTVDLVAHAAQVGVKGVLLLPPYYYKGVSEEGLYRFYSTVVESVGRNELRVVLYHIPQMSQVPIPHDLIERLMDAYPGIVCGIKDSSGDFGNMTAMAERFPNLGVLAGADPLMLPLLRKGGAGCITANANLRADALRYVWDHRQDGESPGLTAAQERIEAWRALSTKRETIPSVKAMIAVCRGDERWCNLKPPLVELNDTQRAALLAEMEKLSN